MVEAQLVSGLRALPLVTSANPHPKGGKAFRGIGSAIIAQPITPITSGFTHLKKKMREGNGVWLEEIQRP